MLSEFLSLFVLVPLFLLLVLIVVGAGTPENGGKSRDDDAGSD